MSVLDLLTKKNSQPKKSPPAIPHPNFLFQGTGQPATSQGENWSFLGSQPPVKTPQTQNFLAPAPMQSPIVPPGWTYGDAGNGTNGWRNPQGQPGILPNTQYVSPGGRTPQPQWIDPVKKRAAQYTLRTI